MAGWSGWLRPSCPPPREGCLRQVDARGRGCLGAREAERDQTVQQRPGVRGEASHGTVSSSRGGCSRGGCPWTPAPVTLTEADGHWDRPLSVGCFPFVQHPLLVVSATPHRGVWRPPGLLSSLNRRRGEAGERCPGHQDRWPSVGTMPACRRAHPQSRCPEVP